MDKSKKELIAQYKSRRAVGGVFVSKNMRTGKMLLESTTDLQGSKNRFTFAQQTGSCTSMRLQKDWAEYGAEAFSFVVLEELVQGETQTADEFSADIKALKEMWLEKLEGEALY